MHKATADRGNKIYHYKIWDFNHTLACIEICNLNMLKLFILPLFSKTLALEYPKYCKCVFCNNTLTAKALGFKHTNSAIVWRCQ